MRLTEVIAPLGLKLLRPSADLEVRVGMDGAEDVAEVVAAHMSRDKSGNRILCIEIAPGSLPILVPKARAHEQWWEPWVKKILG